MLLAEHLKKRLMTAHGEFVEASELILKSHTWLVRQALLADRFVVSITHVPTAKSERLDLLQEALMKTRQDVKDVKEAFEDYKLDLKMKREQYRQKIIANQDIALRRQLSEQATISWSYAAQRSIALRLSQVRRVQESRILGLELGLASKSEDLLESQRQWNEEKKALTADRDKFKKLYARMVKAHEQAMEDLNQSKGTAEDMAKTIQVLSVEKHRLTEQVKDLEEDKRRLTKQVADLRDEVAILKKEIRRYGSLLKGGETALVQARAETERFRLHQQETEAKLQEACTLEASLRDQLVTSQREAIAANLRVARGLEEFRREESIRISIEGERDRLLEGTRKLEAALTRTLSEANLTISDLLDRANRELEQFKNYELAKVKEQFAARIEELERKNRMLMDEVTLADEVAPHIPVLNPLVADRSKLCASCRKAFVFEGTHGDEDNGG